MARKSKIVAERCSWIEDHWKGNPQQQFTDDACTQFQALGFGVVVGSHPVPVTLAGRVGVFQRIHFRKPLDPSFALGQNDRSVGRIDGAFPCQSLKVAQAQYLEADLGGASRGGGQILPGGAGCCEQGDGGKAKQGFIG